MTIAAVDAITAYLVTAGLGGGSTGWTVSTWQHKDAAKDIAVLHAGGPEPLRQAERNVANPRLQIQIRGAAVAFEAAMNKAEAIRLVLDGATITGFHQVFAQQSGPLNLGFDDGGRHLFVVNIRMQDA